MHNDNVTNSRGLGIKGAGYLISIVSVLLLGAVAWPAPSDPQWVKPVLMPGVATSITGMVLRLIAHLRQQRGSSGS